MSDPIATPQDLANRLGRYVETTRATEIIADAQSLAEIEIGAPLPAAAKVIVLKAAQRAYAGTPGISQEIAGPATVTYTDADVYLTKGEQRALRRCAGKGRVFSVDIAPAAASGASGVPWWDHDHAPGTWWWNR